VEIDDPAVPAVVHLTGSGAGDVLGAAVQVAGGTLHGARTTQVQYRPGSDLVVRYRAEVTWADGQRRSETLLAAANRTGALPGTIPVVADADDELVASVWRWPFDPIVVGLEDAVTTGRVDDLVAPVTGSRPAVEVIAYRPTERAVVRLTGDDGTVAYLKAVPPALLPDLVDRHQRLLDIGLPVPEVLAADPVRGIAVLRALPGSTLRERIKGGLPGWPDPSAIEALLAGVHRADPTGLGTRAGRVADGIGHAQLVATIAPELRPALEVLTARFAAEAAAVAARSGAVVHGDLHEGQLIVDPGGAITGLLDVDDLSAGDPVDDLATLIGHLRFRADGFETGSAPARRLHEHVSALHEHAAGLVGAETIDVAVAAVLVGLATGPYRVQHAGWPGRVAGVVDHALGLVAPWADMRGFSAVPHEDLTLDAHGGDRHRIPLMKGRA
jgi:hypothetical protein